MKKQINIGLFLALAIIISATAWARPVPPSYCMKVERDPADPSVIVITGEAGDVKRQNFLVQYLPDDFKSHNFNKKVVAAEVVSETQRKFKMDSEGLKLGLIGFNFANSDSWTLENVWLGLPSAYVLMGSGIKMTMSSQDPNIPLSGGAHFINRTSGFEGFVPNAGWVEGNGTACGEKPAATAPATKKPCKVTIYGDSARTQVLKSIIESYWGAEVTVNSGTGQEVTVVGGGGKREVPISDKLLKDLQKLTVNPNGENPLERLCPMQARLLREAVKCD